MGCTKEAEYDFSDVWRFIHGHVPEIPMRTDIADLVFNIHIQGREI